MRFVRNLAAALSLYSRIPVPRFVWREDDLKYNLVFLPWVGAIVGAIVYALTFLPGWGALPTLAKTAALALVPLLATGGFHLDGFMDVQDALRSYKPREEKLRILKDPHIGAFAVISAAVLALFWLGALSVLVDRGDRAALVPYAASFYEARCAAALLAYTLKPAKKDGMLARETRTRDPKILAALAFETALGVLPLWRAPAALAASVLAFSWSAFRFKRLVYREFGGVTGDTAGYFIVWTECAAAVLYALLASLKL